MLNFWLILLGSNVVIAQFSDCDREEIVEQHNEIRSQIALGKYSALGTTFPTATNMLKMSWSPEIEAEAQAYSNKCVFEHAVFGENLYQNMISPGYKLDIEGHGFKACGAWVNEFQTFGWNGSYVTRENNPKIGHATQTRNYATICNKLEVVHRIPTCKHTFHGDNIVCEAVLKALVNMDQCLGMAWALSSKIGCGATLCSEGRRVFVVCRYQEIGNNLAIPIYKTGATCSQCPSGTSCEKESGLCV